METLPATVRSLLRVYAGFVLLAIFLLIPWPGTNRPLEDEPGSLVLGLWLLGITMMALSLVSMGQSAYITIKYRASRTKSFWIGLSIFISELAVFAWVWNN